MWLFFDILIVGIGLGIGFILGIGIVIAICLGFWELIGRSFET